jgi:ribosomal-protein-serine acetyltransferase
MSLPEQIDAGAVRLRRWQVAEAPDLAAAVRDSLPELALYMPWASGDPGVDEAREYLQTSDREWNEGTAWNYAVVAADGHIAGSCGLMTRLGPGVLEIGYWIRTADCGRGYATSLATSLAGVALAVDGIGRVVIKHDEPNTASGRVAAKANFVRTGTIAADIGAPGQNGVQVVWELRHALL